jgi:Arc/MetJ-type ribon-helix-helix transcriptional regulator
MSHEFPPKINQRIQAHIALGDFNTPAEVVASALDALEQRNEDLASIERGMADELAGRLTPLERFDADLRAEFGMAAGDG